MKLDFLQSNSVIIVPSSLKLLILKEVSRDKELFNIKYMTREEFIEKSTFSYDERAILYLMDKYGYDSDVIKTMISNMYYVEDKDYSNTKLNDLVKLKKELLEENLLVTDRLFSKYLENKKIFVYGYFYVDNIFKKYLSKYDYEIISDDASEANSKVVYEAKTIEEEMEFLFNNIGELLNNGIDIDKIKIVNYTDKYSNVLYKLANFFNIPVEEKGYAIYGTKIVQEYLKYLLDSKNILDSFNYIKDKYDDESSSKIISLIQKISNKYNGLDYSFKSIYTLIKKDFQKSTVKDKDYLHKVSLMEMNAKLFQSDDYVFLIGFNQNELPKLYSDEDYLCDLEKNLLGIEDSVLKNKIEKDRALSFINNVTNLKMSYPLSHLSNEYHPSNLISENSFKVEKINLSSNTSYSKKYASMKLTKYLDDFIKFGTIDNNLYKYYSNYKIDYLTYDNKFTGLRKERLLKRIDNKLVLSYSAINNYNKCHFRYYIENIMKLNKYEETFSIKVGNLFHYLLSICFQEDFDLDKEWEEYLKKLTLDDKEQVLLLKLKDEFSLILDFVKNLHQETGLINSLMEHKVYIDKSRDVEVGFMGVIDKCMYKEKNGETLISIIDYKTGTPSTDLCKVAYGIDMQLPIYWYLVKKGNLFDNSKFVGFYLQKILHGELKRDDKKSYREVKLDNLKLVGYSTNDQSRLEVFDPTYEKSSYIKGMTVKKDGEFASYVKVLDDKTLDLLVEYIDKIIEENITSILDGDFSINPKQLQDEVIGCKYCKYNDICYRRNEDILKLKYYEDLSFLGGGENNE